MSGKSKEKLDVPTSCDADCMLGKWLHSEGGKLCTDIGLLDSICMSCEEFHEAAAQAVLLADMGKFEMAKAALEAGQVFHDASEKLQQNLVDLYVTY